MIDSGLVQQAATLLTPLLPYLMSPSITAGKDAAVKALGGKFVEAGWNKATAIWEKFRPEVEKKPEVAQVLNEVAENTDDPDSKTVVSGQLKKILAEMPTEAVEEIRSIFSDKTNEVGIIIVSNRSVAIGGNASNNIINIGGNSHHSTEQQQQTDDTDFRIMQAIKDFGSSIPNADRIIALVNIDPEELGARIGILHSKGLIKAEYDSNMPGFSLPNGIYAAGLTDQGRLALIKRTRD